MPQLPSINSQARYKRRSEVNQGDHPLSFTWNVGGCQRVSEFRACGSSVITKIKQQCQTTTSEKKDKD